jgi:hypothetical protein
MPVYNSWPLVSGLHEIQLAPWFPHFAETVFERELAQMCQLRWQGWQGAQATGELFQQ